MKYLAKKFKLDTFVETGTFKGYNAIVQSRNFRTVYTCDNNLNYLNIAKEKAAQYKRKNIKFYWEDSCLFLSRFLKDKYLFYLDAHFYDKSLPKGKGKFVVLKELKVLANKKDAVGVIHDFCNGLGGIEYDGIKLDFDLIYRSEFGKNPHWYYTNTLASCDIVKKASEIGIDDNDADMQDYIKFVWSSPVKTYRGFLYILPNKLTKKECNKLGLREL